MTAALGLSGTGTWLLRADASPQIGVGHVVRCLTIAEAAIATGHRCVLLSRDLPEGLSRRAAALGVEVLTVTTEPGTAEDGADTARTAGPDTQVVVLDGYHLGPAFRAALRQWSGTLVCVDDNLESDPREVDVIVNHAPHARAEDYQGRAGLLLLGPRFALIRREITELLPVIRPPHRVERVVVTMGGADVQAATVPLCRAILDRTDLRVEAVTGLANPRADEIAALATERPDRVSAVPPDELPEALARADIGVIAAGGTVWEAAALGLPTIAVVTADNQRALAATPEVRSFAMVRDAGITDGPDAVDGVAELARDDDRRANMSVAATALIDGLGATRVVAAVLDQRSAPVSTGGRRGSVH